MSEPCRAFRAEAKRQLGVTESTRTTAAGNGGRHAQVYAIERVALIIEGLKREISATTVLWAVTLASGSVFGFVCQAVAQDNYEIQVYGYDTVDPGHTMVELHSNFTIDGSKAVVDGVLPTNHAEHETIEITHGVTDWFEVGFYIFTSERNG